MNNKKVYCRIALVLLVGFALSACGVINPQEVVNEESGEPIGLANPAAVYCQGLGYTLENVEREGGLDADCLFPDGERCAQWDFLAGRCARERSYCALQGGKIQEFGNMGMCEFPDGSTCGEFQLFSGQCALGDFPAQEQAELEEEEILDEETEVVDEIVELKGFSEARDYLVDFFAREYGIEIQQDWMEQDLTSADAAGVQTIRFVSGPVTILLSAEASAPYASSYTVREASNLSNGFHWAGSVAFDGTISEGQVSLPYQILNAEQARDAALGYLDAKYDISAPLDWLDQGLSQAGDFQTAQQFSSGSWQVVIEFQPAAPFVSSYAVRVENSPLGLKWTGQVSGQGEIVQLSFAG